MTANGDEIVELLRALGHLYSRHGQQKRGLILLLIAARLAPDDQGVLRTLAHSFLVDRSAKGVLAVIERLQAMPGADDPALDLLRSRALWLAGETSEAKRVFRNALERRGEI